MSPKTDSQDATLAVLNKPKLFVSGYAKSGTTWLQLLLDAHPQIACKGEGHIADVLARELEAAITRYSNFVDAKNKTIFKEIEGFPKPQGKDLKLMVRFAASIMFAKFGADPAVQIVGEKTPDTVGYLPQMADTFPEARFMFIHRDGRDVLTSLLIHNERTGGAATTGERSLEEFAHDFGQDWARVVDTAQAFVADDPVRGFELRYEDLLVRPADTLCSIYRWLGVSADEGVVDDAIKAASFETLSGGRQIGEEDAASHFRKGGAGHWKSDLAPEALRGFTAGAGAALGRLGYAL